MFLIVLSGFVSASLSKSDPNLVSVWSMDIDGRDSAGTDNLTVNGGPSIDTAEYINASYLFSSGAMNLQSSYVVEDEDFTWSVWFKTTASGTTQDIFDGNNPSKASCASLMRVETDNTLKATLCSCEVDCVSIHSPSSVTDSSWHFGVLTYNDANDNLTLYLDGSMVDTATRTDFDVTYQMTQMIGNRRWDGSTHDFIGNIDQLTVWNRTLTESEISELYNSGNGYAYVDWGSSSVQNFSVSVSDEWSGSSVINVSVEIGGVNYTNSSGSVVTTPILQNDSSLYNLTVYANGGDYFSRFYSNVNVSSDLGAVLHQSEYSFSLFELFSNSSLSGNCSIGGVVASCSSSWNLSVGSYNVSASVPGYFSKVLSFNVSALDVSSPHIEGFASDSLNLSLLDATTNSFLAVVSNVTVFNDDYNLSFNLSQSSGNYSNVTLIDGNYTVYGYASNYADNNVSFVVNSSFSNQSLLMYSANSLWVTAKDLVSGVSLTGFNVTVYNSTQVWTFDDNASGVARGLNITGGVYTVKVEKSGYMSSSYTVTMAGGSHQDLVAYLTTSTSNVIFTIKNSLSGAIVEGASVSQYQIINSSWTLINSFLSDLTGRVQFPYNTGTEYKFSVVASGYDTKTFNLIPLFASYDVVISPSASEVASVNTGDYFWSVDPVVYYDGVSNNMTFSITSSTGSLEYYVVNVSASNVSFQHNYSNAIGGVYNYSFVVGNSSFGDLLRLRLWIKQSGVALRFVEVDYPITDITGAGTLYDWKNSDVGLGSFGKASLATIILLVVVGMVATVTSMLGVGVLLPSALTFLALLVIFGVIGFVPSWSIYIAGVALMVIVFFSLRGDR